ncbi:Uncharacterised protein [Serratia fonticola]|uniref:Bacterial Ig-like domain-containing protein n=1 Tax=Serratia fonticola TaxID=47917 RepID=A0A4U9UHK0_SERFO|nr:Uncharacterised protein [Serratia fonticola]
MIRLAASRELLLVTILTSLSTIKRQSSKVWGNLGAQLEVRQDGELIGFTDVDMNGNWSFIPSVPLQEGGHIFSVCDPATNQYSANSMLFIDTVAPLRSEISSVAADNTGTHVAISKNGYTNDNTPTLTGKGEPNCLIAILQR